ncbi:MAG: CAAX protease [Brasilonema angustatum HA4187-MV1]|jgi:predicted Abi (CAAX) family protease|nr:CAAX protease [Brasilonema angustatum HA4187-MV1]
MNVKRVSIFLGIVFIAVLCTVLFPELSHLWLGWYNALGGALKLTVDLLQISFIAILFAGLLAPLEALGWWAGWYGDKVDTKLNLGILEQEIPPQTNVVRYVIYLDGIGQASFKYFPDGDQFLHELAIALPNNIVLIKGIIPYSVFNRPLTEGGILSPFWRFAERRSQSKNGSIFNALLTLAINIRNLLVVAVSADQRFGPIYNQGTAQVMYNSLINHGYKPGSAVPITLIGFSGGGQIAMGALSYLKQALDKAPIEVISLAGVISGNTNALLAEHLYHLVGDKDPVERLGPILFAKRWKVFFLSYWNRAKRLGKISFVSLGPVGHMGAGGPLDANKFLSDGRSYLRQTVDIISGILRDEYPYNEELVITKLSNYERYREAAFNRPEYYPLNQSVNTEFYEPIAPWMGRLILPPQDQRESGVLFEVHHADAKHKHLVGQIVYLQWIDDPESKVSVQSTKKDVHFNAEALYNYTRGKIVPIRINHWRQVTPLESLAGSRPNDDIVVKLREPIVMEQNGKITLSIISEPVQISGRFYGLVKFLQPIQPGSEQFRVIHFNRASRKFNSVEEVVLLPEVIPSDQNISSSTKDGLEKSPLNETGWYIYGAKNAAGMFVVQAIAPRALLRVQPREVVVGRKLAMEFLKKRSWNNIITKKGQIQSVLLNRKSKDIPQAVSKWREGECALLLHVYGGIGGKKREIAAKGPVYFGHCAYGVAEVVREPLTGELRFEIEYHQVYCHNVDGLIAGTLSWTRYMGDRQFGWLGIRPVCDTLIKLDALTNDYDADEVKRTLLGVFIRELEIMTARYRIGDGMGATYVGPANNCAQDSNQALYAAIKVIQAAIQFDAKDIAYAIKNNPEFKNWLLRHPEYATSFKQLVKLDKAIRHDLLPFGIARADWEDSSTTTIGSSLEDSPLQQILKALVSWRSILPRKASDSVTDIFHKQGASLWILSTSQVGNSDPEIAAVAPLTF